MIKQLKISAKLFFAVIFGILIGSHMFAFADTSKNSSNKPVPIEDIQGFTNVIENVKKYYVKNIDDSELFNNAIKGMISSLDPHSSFLDKEEFSELRSVTAGKFGGLGLEVTAEDGFVKVISPIDDTPASKAGIQSGDLIVKIEDKSVRGLSLREAVDKMRGPKGTPVHLTIFRQGESKPIEMNIVRDDINVRSVRSSLLDGGYGYVRVSQFQLNSGKDLISALDKLKVENNNTNLKGIILDLRNNPGGIIDGAIEIADVFLDKDKHKNSHDGLIVFTKGRYEDSEVVEKIRTKDLTDGAPVVVLVNGGSASASEIVAGALQDHKRGIVVGTKTFGKGSVQVVLPLKNETGIKLTTALYYTPAARSIQATGIEPDILVENMKFNNTKVEESVLAIKEADLEHHLENGNGEENKSQEKNITAPKENPILRDDYQLQQALLILKTMNFTTKQNV